MIDIKLCEKERCTGCMACYNTCPHGSISINSDEEGFAVPVINHDTCLKCGKCMRVCPILNGLKPIEEQTAFKGWTRDEKLLEGSSSGGVFSLLSSQVIADGGYVYGAAFDENLELRHVSVHTEEEMSQLRGSKYVQSYIGETYREIKQILDEGSKVLFCGTPCQVAGLKAFLTGKKFPNLLTIDIACHGVPSPKVFKSYIKWMEQNNGSKIISYSFRDKKWSWRRYNTSIRFKNGTKYLGKWEQDPWSRGFLRDLFLRPSCHNCIFSNMRREGDITLADMWSYVCKKGEENNRDRGCSLILLNNDKGLKAFEECKSNMVFYPISKAEAQDGNQALQGAFPVNPMREQFWQDYNSFDFDILVKKYMYPEPISSRYKRIYKYGRKITTLQYYYVVPFAKKILKALLIRK